MTEVFFVYNGDHWQEFATQEAAMDAAEAAIDYAQSCCDPEWPYWVGKIGVYAARNRLIAYAKEVEIPTPEGREHEDADYWCDYVMVETADADH